MKCPQTKSATHCLTKLFPIYQNKHWNIQRHGTIVLSTHRPSVLYWRLMDFWSLRECQFVTHSCHALLNNYQLLSTPKNEYLTGKQLQIMLTCKMSSNMNHSKLQIWDKNCWAMDVATHIAIYCGKQQRCFFCRKSANIQVLIFCVEFRELSHLPRDLSQDEKKINFVTRWANAQNDIYFTQKGWSCYFGVKIVVILSVAQLVTTVIFFLSLR